MEIKLEIKTVKEIIQETQNKSLSELSVSPYYEVFISKDSLKPTLFELYNLLCKLVDEIEMNDENVGTPSLLVLQADLIKLQKELE